MKELNQQEMELVAGAGWKEGVKVGVDVIEKAGEIVVDILEGFGIISHKTGQAIKGGLKYGEDAVDKVIDAF
ncbi:hypothetical protein [Xenorhabdus innexi]|uniref:Uncharacterized protein n=1 Tax=Xenorhabdus innexi TaxID=290109 RepID=A0A1N6MXA0_9GAMM|nr:hypothetical protein [Xenorhabdus innexi]PHM33535.1 hypothetical protein Xinn_02352 [Xenorhabdus innexi]SIP73369.1 hypothetical protein XIS1_190006 [Xenorhabdus innexi]